MTHKISDLIISDYGDEFLSLVGGKLTPISADFAPVVSVDGVIGTIADISARLRADEEKRKFGRQFRNFQKMEAIGTSNLHFNH